VLANNGEKVIVAEDMFNEEELPDISVFKR